MSDFNQTMALLCLVAIVAIAVGAWLRFSISGEKVDMQTGRPRRRKP